MGAFPDPQRSRGRGAANASQRSSRVQPQPRSKPSSFARLQHAKANGREDAKRHYQALQADVLSTKRPRPDQAERGAGLAPSAGYYKASAQLFAPRSEVMNLPHFGLGLAETIIIRMPHSFLCVALTTPCCLFCQRAPRSASCGRQH